MLIAQAQQKEELLDSIARDIENHQSLRARLVSERDQLQGRLEEVGEIRSDLRQLDGFEEELRTLDQQLLEKRQEIQTLVAAAWWMPLERFLQVETERAHQAAQ